MNLVLVGPPGGGKGTQAARLVRQLALLPIATGDILRAAVAGGTDLGEQVAAILEAGGLVADDVMVRLIRERLSAADARYGWLLDGFPRTVPQAEALVRNLEEIEQTVHAVVRLSAPDEEILTRLTGRLTCRECGVITSRAAVPAGENGACPGCGREALFVRNDDHEETIRRRLEIYRRETEPVAEMLSRHYPLRNVSGVGTPEDVNQRLRNVLG